MLVFTILLLTPLVARAEVMDKEFSLCTVLAMTATLAAMLYATGRHAPRLAAVPAVAAAIFFGLHGWELADPFVGPAIRREAGVVYVVAAALAPVVVAIAFIVGKLRRRAASGGA